MATLLEIRTQARERADMTESTFVTDSEFNSYINGSLADLYDILVSAYEDYYTIVPAPEYTVASGDETLDLPSNFYKLRGIDVKLSNNDYSTVQQFPFSERNDVSLTDLRRFLVDSPVAYRIIGGKIQFMPADLAPNTYRLWYVPAFTPLSSDTDTFDGINGWEQYAVVDAAIKALAKEESDTAALQVEKERLIKRITEMAADRDAGAPERISDITLVEDRLTDIIRF